MTKDEMVSESSAFACEGDTETKDREDCPVINAHCKYYGYQCDNNGEVAISFCAHLDNPDEHEGNCLHGLCPLVEEDITEVQEYHGDNVIGVCEQCNQIFDGYENKICPWCGYKHD